VAVDAQRRLDRGVVVAAGVDERVVEVRGDAVRLHPKNTVSRRGEPVVARQLPRARVFGADVLVAARSDEFFRASFRVHIRAASFLFHTPPRWRRDFSPRLRRLFIKPTPRYVNASRGSMRPVVGVFRPRDLGKF